MSLTDLRGAGNRGGATGMTSTELAQLQQITLNQRLILEVNPWMANAPGAMLELAQSGADPESLTANSAAMAGMQHMDEVAQTLTNLSPVAARATYSKLTEQQQRALAQMGYQPVDPFAAESAGLAADIFSGAGKVIAPIMKPVSSVAGPVLGKAFDTLTWIADVPSHLYRTIRQMDSWQQWVALGVATGVAVGGVIAAPFTFGGSLAATAGSLGTIGAIAGTALAAGAATTAVTNVTDLGEWWDIASNKNGERIFTGQAKTKAREILGNADHLDSMARNIAANVDLYDLAEEFAGQRDSTNENVLTDSIERVVSAMADVGTPEYEQLYQGVATLLEQPEFRQAVDELQNGKISFGRDVVRTFGMEPGDFGYGVASGSIDAIWQLAVDPMLLLGKLGKLSRITRFGVDIPTGEGALARITDIVESEAGVGRVFDDVATALQDGNFAALPKTWRGMWDGMNQWQRANQAAARARPWDREHVLDYIATGGGLKQMMEGKATIRGLEMITLSKATPSAGWGRFVDEMRQFRDGLNDQTLYLRMQETAKKYGVEADINRMVASDYFELPTGGGFAMREIGGGYNLGSKIGERLVRIPGGKSVTELMTSITMMAPPGRSIRLAGPGSESDVARFVESFGRHFNVPSFARDEWLNAVMTQGTIAQRRAVVASYMDSALTAGGMRSTDQLSQFTDNFLNKYHQAYATGGMDVGRIGLKSEVEQIMGVYPELDQAIELVIPRVRDMAAAVRSGHILKNVARITDSNFSEQVMSRMWKPAVIMRIGFIPRAVGEEMLAFFLRVGEGSMVQEMASQTVGQGKLYDDAVKRVALLDEARAGGFLDEVPPLTDLERKALDFRYPTPLRPLVAMGERVGWQPFSKQTLDSWTTWVRGNLETGLGYDVSNANLNPILESVLFGREHSWRRMIANGVDPDFTVAAQKWVLSHSDAVMRQVGSLESSLMDRSIVNPDASRILTLDPKNPGQRIETPVVLSGHRARVDSADSLYLSGQHHRMARWMQDGPMAEVVPRHLGLYLAPEFANLSGPRIVEAVERGRSAQTRAGRIVLNELLIPREDDIRQTIAHLRTTDPDIADALQAALNVSETPDPTKFVEELRNSAALLELEAAKLGPKAGERAAQRARYLNQVAGEIQGATPLLQGMAVVSPQEQQWIASIIALDQRGGGYFSNEQLRGLARGNKLGDKATLVKRPTNVLYRGVGGPETMRINEDGSLTLIPQYQDHYEGNAVSFALHPEHSMTYMVGGVNSGASGQLQTGALLEVDADAVYQIFGTTHDEVLNNPTGWLQGREQAAGVYNLNGEEISVFSGTGKQLDKEAEPAVEALIANLPEPTGDPEEYYESLVAAVRAYNDDPMSNAWVRASLDSSVARVAPSVFDLKQGKPLVKHRRLHVLQEDMIKSLRGFFGNDVDITEGVTIPAGRWKINSNSEIMQRFADVESSESRWANGLKGVQSEIGGAPLEDVLDDIDAVLDDVIGAVPAHLRNGLEYILSQNALEQILSEPNLREGIAELEELAGQFAGFMPDDVSPIFNELRAVLSEEVDDGITRFDIWRELNNQTEVDGPFSMAVEGRMGSPRRQGFNHEMGEEYDMPDTIGGWIQAKKMRGAGGWQTETVGEEWSPFYEDIEQVTAGMVNDLTAMLMRPENQHMLMGSGFGQRLEDGTAVAKPLQEGIARVYVPQAPNDVSKLLDRIEVAIPPEMEGAFTAEGMKPFANELLGQVGQSRMSDPVVSALSDDERVDIIAGALARMRQHSAYYRQPVTMPIQGLGYDDPRIARWVGSVLAGGATDASVATSRIGYVDIPRTALVSGGQSVNNVRLDGEFGAAGRRWQLANQYVPQTEMVDATNMVALADGSVQPGATLETATKAYAERIIKQFMASQTRGYREWQIPKELEPGFTGLARRSGETYEAIQPGERLIHSEDLFDVDQAGTVQGTVNWGDNARFDHAGETNTNEIMWNVLGPMLRDVNEQAAGMARRIPYQLSDDAIDLSTGAVVQAGIGMQSDPNNFVMARRNRMTDLHNEPAGALPNIAITETYKVVPNTMWDKVVRYGFDTIIGPMIDSLARKPMAYHYFAHAYKQNRRALSWMLSDELFRTSIPEEFRSIIAAMDTAQEITPAQVKLAQQVAGEAFNTTLPADAHSVRQWVSSLARNQLEYNDAMLAAAKSKRAQAAQEVSALERAGATDLEVRENSNWILADQIDEMRHTMTPESLAPGLRTEGIGGNTSAERLVNIYHDAVPDEVWSEGHDGVMAYLEKYQPHLPRSFTPRQWEVLKAGRDNMKYALDTVDQTARFRAIENVIPFIDSHEQRTVFAEMGRNLIPFWYAEENFLKRWGRTLSLGGAFGLDTLRKAQLMYMGVKSAGVIRTDENGKDWFVYPGSGLLIEAVSKIPGFGDVAPAGVLFQASTDSILPGINPEFGSVSPSPFVGASVGLITRMFPDATPLKRAVLGEVAASKGIFEQFIPSTVSRMWQAAFSDEENNARYGSAMMAAIAMSEAQGKGLDAGATPAQMEEYLDKMRNHARIIMYAQAITGFVSPGAPVAVATGNPGGSLEWLTGVGIEDPRQVTNAIYRDYVSNLGVDEGTAAFLAAYEHADMEDIVNPLALTTSMSTSESGAPLPATKNGLKWYTENQTWVDEMPEAGAWFIPVEDSETGEAFDYYSYSQQLTNGLRKRRTPEDFLVAVKYRQGADRYFASREAYEDAVIQVGSNQDAKRKLDEQWEYWKNDYLAAHPIFSEELQSGKAGERRARTIEQLRYAVNDPSAPASPSSSAIRELVLSYDSYRGQWITLSQKRDAASVERVRLLKQGFEDWVTAWTLRNPSLERLWSSVYQPEAGLD